MPWGRCDDTFYDHGKVRAMPVALRNAACGLHWRAISFCNRHLTDGRVRQEDVDLLDGTAEQVAALVTAGLWRKAGKGWRIHDYLVFNKSRDQVLKERADKAEIGRLGGIQSGKQRRSRALRDGEAKPKQRASRLVEPKPKQRELNSQSRPSPVPDASIEASPPDPPDDLVDVYYRLTIRPPSRAVIEWLDRLESEHGQAVVAEAMGSAWQADPSVRDFLGRVEVACVSASRQAERRRVQREKEAERAERERIEAMPPAQRQANLQRLGDMMRENGLLAPETPA